MPTGPNINGTISLAFSGTMAQIDDEKEIIAFITILNHTYEYFTLLANQDDTIPPKGFFFTFHCIGKTIVKHSFEIFIIK